MEFANWNKITKVWFFPLDLLLDRFITGTTCAVFSLYNTSFILINLESNNFWEHSCEYRASKYKKTKQQYSWKHLFSCTCIYTKQHTHVYALMLTINYYHILQKKNVQHWKKFTHPVSKLTTNRWIALKTRCTHFPSKAI